MIRRPLPLWQRNLIGATVAAAAVAVLAVTDLWPQWVGYQDRVRPAHVVAARQSLPIDGQSWSIAEVRHLGRSVPAGAPALPKNTVLTVVTVERSGPMPAGQACMGVLTDGDNRWRGQTPSVYNIRRSAGTGFNCTQPGPVQWAFLVPDDVVPSAVDITALDGAILVRLQL